MTFSVRDQLRFPGSNLLKATVKRAILCVETSLQT